MILNNKKRLIILVSLVLASLLAIGTFAAVEAVPLIQYMGHIYPMSNNTYDFGASGNRWAAGYFQNLYTNNIESYTSNYTFDEQFDIINAKLDAIKVAAEAATSNASLAVVAAQLAATNAASAVVAAQSAATKVDLFNSAETYMFPDNVAKYCLFASGANNTFGAWTEIKDNLDASLSANFTTKAGYIADIYLYAITKANTFWMIELAYGSDKTSIGRIMFESEYMDIAQIKSRKIPAGETIYYRMMANTPPTEYVCVGLRYFFE